MVELTLTPRCITFYCLSMSIWDMKVVELENINIGIETRINGILPLVTIAKKMATRTIIIITTTTMPIDAPRWTAICQILIGHCWDSSNTNHTVIGSVNSSNMKECASGPRMNIPS